ncbi:hypothetical protein EG346_20090 [Chryseobacterium carnipullorum]|uniref:Lipoprotein n=1 Tax=Chryseobacterium carnipullorum TaxID=1124835 RepID=A0A376DZF5_CHRCU|nr:hypothetical protein [Chryseobacterium carnipullorum]AZA50336.1 hypothetical protein EG346_20090 [Chryseobacterium carnipullorum]AZA65209.1 hypothetical protein EG345_11145 [Chryseobacterium carnipullorum]STC98744.1 Uncharacterised protein [Chryseobacterium carnipullorum]
MKNNNIIMKRILYMFICLGVVSCTQTNKNETIKQPKRKTDSLIITMENKFPNYKDNSLVREEMEKYLSNKADSIFVFKEFDDIPMSVFKLSKNPYGKGMLVQLYADNKYEKNENKSNYLTFDIIGFISDEEAKKINEKSKYYVIGKNVNRINSNQLSVLVPMSYYSPETKIDQDSFGDTYLFNLGIAAMEVDSLKLINETL